MIGVARVLFSPSESSRLDFHDPLYFKPTYLSCSKFTISLRNVLPTIHDMRVEVPPIFLSYTSLPFTVHGRKPLSHFVACCMATCSWL